MSKRKRTAEDEGIRATNSARRSLTIVSIDVGRKNLAVCVYDGISRKGLLWKNYDTHLKNYAPSKYRKILTKIMLGLPPGDVYLIEKQVPRPENHKNLIVEAMLHCIVALVFQKKPVAVNPKDVSEYFGMTKDRKAKKRDAVAICEQILKDEDGRSKISMEAGMVDLFIDKKKTPKRDDLADCFLQAVYYNEKQCATLSTFEPLHYLGHEQYKYSQFKKKNKKAHTMVGIE